MSNTQFKELYEQTELLGNLLFYKEEELYMKRVEAEPDKKRQKEMRSYIAMGNEVGDQMGIVWEMHKLYKAQNIKDIEEVKSYFQNLQIRKELQTSKA